MSDRDRAAAVLHMWKRAYEGTGHAVEFYPCRYVDDPVLQGLDPLAACDHAAAVTGSYEGVQHRLGVGEVDRLYNLALADA